MLGLSYTEFKRVYKKYILLINNTLFYNNIKIELPTYYSSDFYSDEWNLYDLFFRFKNEVDAFKFYKTFLDYDYVIKMCNTFVHIYNINILYENNSMYIQTINNMDLVELRHLVNTNNNYTKNKRILKQSKNICPG